MVFAATSGIGRAVAEALLAGGEDLLVTGRSAGDVEALARHLEVTSGRPVPWLAWDVTDFPGHANRFKDLVAGHPVKGLFMAAGVLIPQEECDADPDKTRLTFDANLTGPAAVMGLFAAHFREKGSGFISCVSSVAGDRGRAKITAYAASKAGLSAWLEGLGNRLRGSSVLVQTVKPGYVRTRMTEGVRSPLMASPQKAARDIVRAIGSRRRVVYTPGYWKYIMLIIKAIPAPLFRRLGL